MWFSGSRGTRTECYFQFLTWKRILCCQKDSWSHQIQRLPEDKERLWERASERMNATERERDTKKERRRGWNNKNCLPKWNYSADTTNLSVSPNLQYSNRRAHALRSVSHTVWYFDLISNTSYLWERILHVWVFYPIKRIPLVLAWALLRGSLCKVAEVSWMHQLI